MPPQCPSWRGGPPSQGPHFCCCCQPAQLPTAAAVKSRASGQRWVRLSAGGNNPPTTNAHRGSRSAKRESMTTSVLNGGGRRTDHLGLMTALKLAEG